MRVSLKSNSSIEEACISFERSVLAGVFYHSDDMEGSLDVMYTFPADTKSVQEWARTAKENGLIDEMEILEDETRDAVE